MTHLKPKKTEEKMVTCQVNVFTAQERSDTCWKHFTVFTDQDVAGTKRQSPEPTGKQAH